VIRDTRATPVRRSFGGNDGFLRAELRAGNESNEEEGDLESRDPELLDVYRKAGVQRLTVEDSTVTLKGVFMPTGQDDFDGIRNAFQLSPEDSAMVVDPGHGQGEFLLRLAHQFPRLQAVGIEYDTDLYNDSAKLLKAAEATDYVKPGRVQFLWGDFTWGRFHEFFGKADYVYYAAQGTKTPRLLAEVLVNQLKPGAKVVEFGARELDEYFRMAGAPFDLRAADYQYVRIYERRSELRIDKAVSDLESAINRLKRSTNPKRLRQAISALVEYGFPLQSVSKILSKQAMSYNYYLRPWKSFSAKLFFVWLQKMALLFLPAAGFWTWVIWKTGGNGAVSINFIQIVKLAGISAAAFGLWFALISLNEEIVIRKRIDAMWNNAIERIAIYAQRVYENPKNLWKKFWIDQRDRVLDEDFLNVRNYYQLAVIFSPALGFFSAVAYFDFQHFHSITGGIIFGFPLVIGFGVVLAGYLSTQKSYRRLRHLEHRGEARQKAGTSSVVHSMPSNEMQNAKDDRRKRSELRQLSLHVGGSSPFEATSFFRHLNRPTEELLFNNFIYELVQRAADGKKIRVLSAGTSTGEEAYTLAMLILSQRVAPEQLQIVGIDRNPEVIEIAKRGIYRKPHNWFEMRPFGQRLFQAYFTYNPHLYEASEELKRVVEFKVADFTKIEDLERLGSFDGIVCKYAEYQNPLSWKAAVINFGKLLTKSGLFLDDSNLSQQDPSSEFGMSPTPFSLLFNEPRTTPVRRLFGGNNGFLRAELRNAGKIDAARLRRLRAHHFDDEEFVRVLFYDPKSPLTVNEKLVLKYRYSLEGGEHKTLLQLSEMLKMARNGPYELEQLALKKAAWFYETERWKKDFKISLKRLDREPVWKLAYFSTRVRETFRKMGIKTIRDLQNTSAKKLMAAKNFEYESLNEVVAALAAYGLKLKEENDFASRSELRLVDVNQLPSISADEASEVQRDDSRRETRLTKSGIATRKASFKPRTSTSTDESRSLTSAISSRSGITTSDTDRNSLRSSSINTATSRTVNASSISNPPNKVLWEERSLTEDARNVNIKNSQFIYDKRQNKMPVTSGEKKRVLDVKFGAGALFARYFVQVPDLVMTIGLPRQVVYANIRGRIRSSRQEVRAPISNDIESRLRSIYRTIDLATSIEGTRIEVLDVLPKAESLVWTDLAMIHLSSKFKVVYLVNAGQDEIDQYMRAVEAIYQKMFQDSSKLARQFIVKSSGKGERVRELLNQAINSTSAGERVELITSEETARKISWRSDRKIVRVIDDVTSASGEANFYRETLRVIGNKLFYDPAKFDQMVREREVLMASVLIKTVEFLNLAKQVKQLLEKAA
jgi:chemotaxis protein methyltransferase CheR